MTAQARHGAGAQSGFQGGYLVINRRIFMASTVAAAVAITTGIAHAEGKGLVGISMPTKSSTRWISDGESMVKEFTALGYETDLQYGEDDIPNQLAQIENMVTKGAKVLIIAAIDGSTLSDILKKAHEAGAKVIAYDRLITKTATLTTTRPSTTSSVGVLQATSLVKGLKERFASVKPWNVELFGGSPDDNNAFFFYDGAMSVLQPMIDAGDIAIVVGPDGHGQGRHAALGRRCRPGPHGQPAVGQLHRQEGARRARRLTTACRAASSRRSRVLAMRPGAEMPIVTGQDAEVASVKGMMAGEQYSTVFKDTRELAKVTAKPWSMP
jgi:putative multiple sugar transport system substrate-binding protein